MDRNETKIALLMIFSGISGIMISSGSFFIRDACCRLENPVVSVHPLNPFQAYVDLPVVVNAEIVTSTT